MSTIVAANISDGIDSTPMGYAVNGSAKSWSKGTPTAVVSGLNIATFTDSGVGIYTYAHTNTFVGAEDAAWCGRMAAGSALFGVADTGISQTVVRIYTSAGSISDSSHAMIRLGDLA